MKSVGKKVLGWFIEEENDDGGGGEVEMLEEHDPPPPRPAEVKPAPDARTFAEVYVRAGLPDAESQRLAKVLELLASLPAEAAADVKRTIVGAALQAFGVPVDQILQTAGASIAALDDHVESGRARTEGVVKEAHARIAKLTAEIEQVRHAVDVELGKQEALVSTTAVEKARVANVLEFFGRPRPIHPTPARLPRLN